MDLRIIEREGVDEAIKEASRAFFSGDRAEVERHFQGHRQGNSTTLLGYHEGELVGILTIRWHSNYPPFRDQGVPLIHYIEIRWEHRGKGLGNKLLELAECFASTRVKKLGICVGIFDAYGPAQRLYIKRGFVPDGRGVCRGHVPLQAGQAVQVDHDLLLWLVKDLYGPVR